jgi:hypothetical protein
MTLRLINVPGEPGMANANQRSRADFMRTTGMQSVYFVRLELPANHGNERADEIGDASVNQQARRIDLKVFAFEMEALPVATNTFVRPFAAHAEVRVGFYYMESSDLMWPRRGRRFDSPPLRPLFGVGNGLEDAAGRSGDEYLRQHCVVVGGESCGCHFSAPDVSRFTFFGEGLQPSEHQRPAEAVAFELIDFAGESAVRKFHQRPVGL